MEAFGYKEAFIGVMTVLKYDLTAGFSDGSHPDKTSWLVALVTHSFYIVGLTRGVNYRRQVEIRQRDFFQPFISLKFIRR